MLTETGQPVWFFFAILRLNKPTFFCPPACDDTAIIRSGSCLFVEGLFILFAEVFLMLFHPLNYALEFVAAAEKAPLLDFLFPAVHDDAQLRRQDSIGRGAVSKGHSLIAS